MLYNLPVGLVPSGKIRYRFVIESPTQRHVLFDSPSVAVVVNIDCPVQGLRRRRSRAPHKDVMIDGIDPGNPETAPVQPRHCRPVLPWCEKQEKQCGLDNPRNLALVRLDATKILAEIHQQIGKSPRAVRSLKF